MPSMPDLPWLAIVAGVGGVVAAAWQERDASGSAAKRVYDTPFDVNQLSDRPGSATPRQIAILLRMGALIPHGKDIHGKTSRISKREASELIYYMGQERRAGAATSGR